MTLPDLLGARAVVPAESVDAMVASVRFDLALLSDHVKRAEAEATELERLVADAPPVRGNELAAFDRMSGYFHQQTLDLEARRRGAVAAARAEADERLARARDEAVLIRLDGPGIDAPAGPVGELLTVAAVPAVEAVEAVGEAAEPVMPAEPVVPAADLLDGVDLTELPELLPILEAMLADEPLPAASPSPVTVDAPRVSDAVDTASGVRADAGEQFDTFWNAPEPPPPPKAARWWTMVPVGALLSMLAIVVVIVLLLSLIG